MHIHVVVVVDDGQALHRRHVLLRERVLRVEERGLLQAVEIGHQEALIRAVVGGQRGQALQQAVVRRRVRRHDEEARVEVARIHVDGAEVAALEELVDVVEEQVVRVHVDDAFVLQHVPHVELVQRKLEVVLVGSSPVLVGFEPS